MEAVSRQEFDEVKALAHAIDAKLNVHEAICAERARSTQTAIESILSSVTRMTEKIDSGKNWLIATLLSVVGVAGLSLFAFLVNRALTIPQVIPNVGS